MQSKKLKVLVVGGGGREHTIVIGLVDDPMVGIVEVAPGNAGTEQIAVNRPVGAEDVEGLLTLIDEELYDLVVVGPEAPLVAGLANKLAERGVPCFGPTESGALLEGSKEYSKRVMADLGVPTAHYLVIKDEGAVESALDTYAPNWVIKRDVLAGGKGVVVTTDRSVAKSALLDALTMDGFVVIEEFLQGEEASLLVVMDESGYLLLPPSQDHKRVGEGDTGPNTGGMGAYAPAPVVTKEVLNKAEERIVKPMHEWLSNQHTPYRGVLYVGLMIDSSGEPRVVEFNVRFGDPEAQVTIPLIESGFGQMLHAAATGTLNEYGLTIKQQHALTVVLAAEGYPSKVEKGRKISIPPSFLIERGEEDFIIHLAGVCKDGEYMVSNGGRVLSVTGFGDDLASASDKAYSKLKEIHLDGAHFRKDIGHRAL